MKILIFLVCLLNSLSSYSATSSIENFDSYAEKSIKDLLKRVKSKNVFAIKLLSTKDFVPEESMSLQIETTVASILQKNSNFESEIVPRSAIKTVWTEKQSIDGSSDIGKLLSKISADYLISIQLRPIETNMIASIQVFGLQGYDEGKLIFSSTPNTVSINGGVALKTSTNKDEAIKELKAISDQLKNITNNNNGLISNPKTLSEKYYNARILMQRGEVDSALPIYEEIVSNKLIFADPVLDMVTILNRIYGNSGAMKYIENKLSKKIPTVSFEYAKLLLNKDTIENEEYITQITKLDQLNKNFFESFPPLSKLILEKINFNEALTFNINNWKTLRRMGKIVKESVNNGDYYAFYLDQIRVEKDLVGFDLKKFSVEGNVLEKISGDWYGLNHYSKEKLTDGCIQEDEISKRTRFDSKGRFCYFRRLAKGEGLIDCVLTPETIEKINNDVIVKIRSSTQGNLKEFQKHSAKRVGEQCISLRFKNLTDDSAELIVDRNCENTPDDKRENIQSYQLKRCTYF